MSWPPFVEGMQERVRCFFHFWKPLFLHPARIENRPEEAYQTES